MNPNATNHVTNTAMMKLKSCPLEKRCDAKLKSTKNRNEVGSTAYTAPHHIQASTKICFVVSADVPLQQTVCHDSVLT